MTTAQDIADEAVAVLNGPRYGEMKTVAGILCVWNGNWIDVLSYESSDVFKKLWQNEE
jgi:hypothetical protein